MEVIKDTDDEYVVYLETKKAHWWDEIYWKISSLWNSLFKKQK